MDWFSQLDLEDRVPCDTIDCEEAAYCWLRAQCCNEILFLCEFCLVNTRKQLLAISMLGSFIECESCGREIEPENWLKAPEPLVLTDGEPPC